MNSTKSNATALFQNKFNTQLYASIILYLPWYILQIHSIGVVPAGWSGCNVTWWGVTLTRCPGCCWRGYRLWWRGPSHRKDLGTAHTRHSSSSRSSWRPGPSPRLRMSPQTPHPVGVKDSISAKSLMLVYSRGHRPFLSFESKSKPRSTAQIDLYF